MRWKSTPAEAADYLNRMKQTPPIFGHIQRARTIDFPIYKKDLPTMMKYFEQAAGAIAREKVFGDNLSKLNAAIGKIPSENGRRTIDDLFQQNWRHRTGAALTEKSTTASQRLKYSPR